ncbi:hypothetical protein AGMMS49532_08460 [Endomicrobiia bacterium]|nr:hypothetical protein AGMMS49532_08460 [Endomicrobiia bacterium]
MPNTSAILGLFSFRAISALRHKVPTRKSSSSKTEAPPHYCRNNKKALKTKGLRLENGFF